MSDGTGNETRTEGQHHADGSITLPPNPWGTSATWADYNWRPTAEKYRAAGHMAAAHMFDLIADAVEQEQS